MKVSASSVVSNSKLRYTSLFTKDAFMHPIITNESPITPRYMQTRVYENELFTSNISIRDFHINKLFNCRGLRL